jgi:hypothetical protein
VNFLIEVLHVESPWQPSKAVGKIEASKGIMPWKHPRVHEEDVPREWHTSNLSNIWVFKINSAIFDVVTAPKQKFSFTIEFKSL